MSNCNAKKDLRPLSPHLTIYKPQITSVLSITHRFSGILLFIGVLVFCLWIFLNMYSSSSVFLQSFVASLFGKIILFGWSFAVYFHLYNGIRHLFWDIGKGYCLKTVTRSGIAVIIMTIISVFLTWGIALGYILK